MGSFNGNQIEKVFTPTYVQVKKIEPYVSIERASVVAKLIRIMAIVAIPTNKERTERQKMTVITLLHFGLLIHWWYDKKL